MFEPGLLFAFVMFVNSFHTLCVKLLNHPVWGGIQSCPLPIYSDFGPLETQAYLKQKPTDLRTYVYLAWHGVQYTVEHATEFAGYNPRKKLVTSILWDETRHHLELENLNQTNP